MQLEPCAQCKRHVAVDATKCPFCDAPIGASPPRSALVGRWSRAAIFAGATTLTACYTSSTGATNTQIQNDTKTAPTKVAQPAPGTGTVHGVVTDQNGALIPNMPVALAIAGTWDSQQNTKTDARGEFVFADVPPGDYQVIYEMPSRPHEGPNLRDVKVEADKIVEANGRIYPHPVDTGPCCKPYGAPPARRRVV
ncbi:MAG: carboxypeptidase regulatory-like domain-containing protein [Kofleriaceae bacterium]|nr:carboxypeptidase regulatory-like domain-containing protein [Kofleriaceae bacterium]